jgi:tRNA-splicing endonuclease subunit Sen2
MTEAGPSTPSRPRTGKFAGQRGRNNNHFKYGAPLPILLPCSPLYPHAQQPDTSHDVAATSRLLAWMASALTLHSESPINPMCSGTFDPMTKSVWVTSQLDKHILFDRGFFGKGNLSRSDPSWWKRRVKVLQGGNSELVVQLFDPLNILTRPVSVQPSLPRK